MILGEDAPFSDPPFFWSAHYDKTINYSGHAQTFDPPEVVGSLDQGDALVRFSKSDRFLAVATVGRDLACLQAEDDLARHSQSLSGSNRSASGR
jgi:3-phenylpropionate/trans-cinnamate dioxygenase ferredoxin reductase subunit